MGENIRSTWFWALAAGVAHVVFVSGVFSTLWSSHFGSLDRLSQRPTGDLARFLEDAWPWVTAAAIGLAFLLGVTAVRRVMRGDWKLVAVRSVIIVFLPVLIELTDAGTQDGSPNDLDLVPSHSLAMLVAITLGPPVLLALDLIALRRPAEG